MATKSFAEFEAELKKCHPTDWVATYAGYERLLEWGHYIAPNKDKAFEFGNGKIRSTLTLRDPGSDKELLRIWPDRPVWFVFTGRLLDRPHLAPDREQIEKEFLNRLADAVGKELEVTPKGDTCKFPLSTLASAETFAKFRDAMEWFIARIGPRRS